MSSVALLICFGVVGVLPVIVASVVGSIVDRRESTETKEAPLMPCVSPPSPDPDLYRALRVHHEATERLLERLLDHPNEAADVRFAYEVEARRYDAECREIKRRHGYAGY